MKIDIKDIEFKKAYDWGGLADEDDEYLYYCKWTHPKYDISVRKAFYCRGIIDGEYINGRKKELKIIVENRHMDKINASIKEIEGMVTG